MKFSELIPVSELQALCESFTMLTGAVTAVLDLDGDILVATGWQDICTQFHRRNPLTAMRCRESDTVLAGQLKSGEKYNVYKCKNGLVDVAVPIIIGGEHVGNFFTGQFFFEEPDRDYFMRQADEFGFDRECYLQALTRAPVFGEDKVRAMMDFFTRLARLIGDMGLARANQEKTNRELRESRHLLQTIIDTAPIRVFWKDRDLRYLGCNPVFAADAGKNGPAEVIGQDDSQMAWTDQAEMYRQDDRNVIETGLAKPFYDEPIATSDGRTTWVRTAKVPLRNRDNEIIGVLGIYDDVTERKRAEEELRHYKDHLEEVVQQRTADLVLARNAAEAANKAKSVFLANMSHELRTPLNAILGFSSMMLRDPALSESQSASLDIISRSGEHLLALINDVLEMAKIEAGRLQLDDVSFDLGGMVRDVIEMMEVRAREKGLRLLIDQSSAFPRYIVGDEARLRQMLINLVGNAIKFTREGGVTIRLGTSDRPDSILLIEVEDSGPGIAPEDRERIFEPFTQLDEQGSNKGSGLGLAITHQFVQLMGGKISLRSELGNGSLFRVELPLKTAAAADIAKTNEMGKEDVVGLAPGQPEYRILVVEDSLENQVLLRQLMESVGFQVKVAENGLQGIELFQSWRPHFIWMDRRMPVMDGLKATKILRSLPGGRDVKIVAVTASAFMEQREEMLDAGLDDFLRKPYRFHEIFECLSKHLGVRYTYRRQSVPEKAVVLTAEMLSVLPDEIRNDLKNALESLEKQRIAHVIENISSYDRKLHKVLISLTKKFDYPSILNALRTN
ncbi:PocR ligand-binding domain-containing protein [Telmatospirillum sp.]|uniref:PocR ligand-binding domain-containing protein n=1 Tax=Telmatospirillum sp. TaxID=2079197 RepID=UPI00283F25FE|nr:PocR ligand-binding domain-containing protein [Telmatospirillum sp.]MDR3438702.1 PocR ligand-binding domain-containing protein [Telmatospirillum sp.]